MGLPGGLSLHMVARQKDQEAMGPSRGQQHSDPPKLLLGAQNPLLGLYRRADSLTDSATLCNRAPQNLPPRFLSHSSSSLCRGQAKPVRQAPCPDRLAARVSAALCLIPQLRCRAGPAQRRSLPADRSAPGTPFRCRDPAARRLSDRRPPARRRPPFPETQIFPLAPDPRRWLPFGSPRAAR